MQVEIDMNSPFEHSFSYLLKLNKIYKKNTKENIKFYSREEDLENCALSLFIKKENTYKILENYLEDKTNLKPLCAMVNYQCKKDSEGNFSKPHLCEILINNYINYFKI